MGIDVPYKHTNRSRNLFDSHQRDISGILVLLKATENSAAYSQYVMHLKWELANFIHAEKIFSVRKSKLQQLFIRPLSQG